MDQHPLTRFSAFALAQSLKILEPLFWESLVHDVPSLLQELILNKIYSYCFNECLVVFISVTKHTSY